MFQPGESVWTWDGFYVTILSGPHLHEDGEVYLIAHDDESVELEWVEGVRHDQPSDGEVNEALGLLIMEEPL